MEGGVKKLVVVGVAAKWAAEFDGQFGYMEVEESLVGAVGGFTGPEGGGKHVKLLAVDIEG